MDRLELEKRSSVFARDVFSFCRTFRERAGGWKPADQLQAAAASVAANYRASGRGRSPDEFVAKMGVVNEEADETVYWLEFVRDTGLSSGPTLVGLLREACELRAIFAASYGTARRNRNARRKAKSRKPGI
jgi:four helix bundle protein